MDCIFHKIRSNKGIKYGYCIYNKERVCLFNCNCEHKQFKQIKTIKKATNKHIKSEINRYSIIYPPLDKCVVCGSKIGLNKHEVYYGRNRQNSIKYGLIISLCQNCHTGNNGIHFNKELCDKWKQIAKNKFEETYKDLDFSNIFYSN